MNKIDSQISLIENLTPSSWPLGYFENTISYVKNDGLWLIIM